MSALRIDLTPTLRLHEQVAELAPTHGGEIDAALAAAAHSMRERGIVFERAKPFLVAMSALVLRREDEQRLRSLAERLHWLVERLVAPLIDSPEMLARYFPAHRRVFPYLAKTRGADWWQVVGRYDVAVTPGGELKVMELNTGCPAAFMIADTFSAVTAEALAAVKDAVGGGIEFQPRHTGTVAPDALLDGLLDLERRSGLEPAGIGILTDENQLTLELDQIAAALAARGRRAEVIDARQLTYSGGRLAHGGRELSLTYNKFRISTPRSPNHCWKDGFEQRYAAFLAGQRDGAIVSVNNLAAMSVLEDKSLLALLRDPQVTAELDEADRRFLDDHILWTARLEDGRVKWQGETIDLLPHVRQHREQFVIKPANEGRGFDVVVGKYADDDQWRRACRVDADVPRIVQQYTEIARFPAVCRSRGQVVTRPMFLTLGLAIIDGRYQGLVSRVSANPVTNVAREGFVQGVFCVD